MERKQLKSFLSFCFAAKARDCTTHNDCSSIPSTSCVRDNDERLRCLCGDNKAPINGQCSDTKKGKQPFYNVAFPFSHLGGWRFVNPFHARAKSVARQDWWQRYFSTKTRSANFGFEIFFSFPFIFVDWICDRPSHESEVNARLAHVSSPHSKKQLNLYL